MSDLDDMSRRLAVFNFDVHPSSQSLEPPPARAIAPVPRSNLEESIKGSESGLTDLREDEESRKASDNSVVSWSSTASKEDATGRNLYVSGFTGSFTDADFKKLCEPFGPVQSAKVMLNIHTGENRGFGFVLFADPQSAAKAFTKLNGRQLRGVQLRVAYSEHQGENLLVESNKLYVRNVPSAQLLPPADLIAYFQTFGHLVAVQNKTLRISSAQQIILGPGSRTVNEAALVPAVAGGSSMLRVLFLEYDSCEAASRCVEATHNTCAFPCCTVPMLAKIYEPQDLRVRRLQGQQNGKRPTPTTHALPSPSVTPPSAPIPFALGAPPQPMFMPQPMFYAPLSVPVPMPIQTVVVPSMGPQYMQVSGQPAYTRTPQGLQPLYFITQPRYR